MEITGASWLDFIGLAMSATLLEAAITGRGVTGGRGRRSYWQVAPRFRPIVGLTGLGVLVLVAADFLARFNLFPRK
jgi:hypothetical protein